jgi:hypothetical protein
MGKLYENIINRSATNREANEKILSAYDKMLMNEFAERLLEAYRETTPGDDFIGPMQKRKFPTKHTSVGSPKEVKKSGKTIAAAMKKYKTMTSFAPKVAKMKTVTWKDIDKMLPDFVAGGDIMKLFKEGTELYEASWLDAARKVVKNHQMLYVNKNGKVSEDKKSGYMMLDATTANMLVTIADALKKETSEQFTSMPLDKAVNIGWKLIKK